jgi:hypothetical protein
MEKLSAKERASLGGKARAKTSREQALASYYANPNFCGYCQKRIEVRDDEKAGSVKKKKFCNRSCSAKFNNEGKDRHREARLHKTYGNSKCTKNAFENCLVCGVPVAQTPYKKNLHLFWKKLYCNDCRRKVQSENGARHKNGYTREDLESLTKAELLAEKKSYYMFKNRVGDHARKVFKESGQSKQCIVCGYSIYTEVCHKKDVGEFPGNTLIKEINDISNLICLCPNHHKELDLRLIQV